MPLKRILPYIPAQLYESRSGTYVGYWVQDPVTGKMRRIRIKLNRIKNRKQRREYARMLIMEINSKLAQGWNPFLEQEAPKSFTKLQDAIQLFLDTKQRELIKRSILSYNSQANIFIKWLKKQNKEYYVATFSDSDAIEFMNWYWNTGIKGKTYNSMKTFLVTVWEWFIENKYAKRNLFKSIKKKKEQRKQRQIIPLDVINQIRDYLKENSPEFYAIFLLTYHGLLRPNEIVQLKPKYFDLDGKLLRVPPKVSKNNKTRLVSLSQELVQALKAIHVQDLPRDIFIFSTGLKPGLQPIYRNRISERWAKMRDELHLPREYQFYSLKDTGIVNMIRAGISLEAVRDQAGHSSLEMTNRYVQLARTEADKQIIDKINF